MYKQTLHLTVVMLLSHVSFSIDFLLVNGCFVCLCLAWELFPRFPKAGYLNIVQPLVLIRWKQPQRLRVIVATATLTFCFFLFHHRLLKLKRNYFFLIKIMVVLISRLVRSVQIPVAFLAIVNNPVGAHLFNESIVQRESGGREKIFLTSEFRNLPGKSLAGWGRNEHWRKVTSPNCSELTFILLISTLLKPYLTNWSFTCDSCSRTICSSQRRKRIWVNFLQV